ncbi:MAG: hypothetical protein C0497_16370 [Gemmatimonas sp.]|nr:hypothetical protein [Gemmatimonas sp.]
MSDELSADIPPPEPTLGVVRVGQAESADAPAIHTGLPEGSTIRALPEILLEGAREAGHSALTWKLISKIVSVGEEERAILRAERESAKSEAEKWRSNAEREARELIDARARWDSVSTLTGAQALLYVVGGVLVGPALQSGLVGDWNGNLFLVALLGIAAIGAGYMLGKLGPRRGK